MHTNVNLAAPIGALALLGTGFILFMGLILLIQALIVRKGRRANLSAGDTHGWIRMDYSSGPWS